MLAYYKKLPKVMVLAPTKKESGSKVMAEKAVKGSSGAGEGGKGAKDLQGTVEMLEQRVKTLEVNHASSSVSLYQSSPVVRIMTNSRSIACPRNNEGRKPATQLDLFADSKNLFVDNVRRRDLWPSINFSCRCDVWKSL